jgi:hypothetical protein
MASHPSKVRSVIQPLMGGTTMQLKALLVCVAVAGVLNVKLSAADVAGTPHGWTVSDNAVKQYEVGYDYSEQATYIRAVVAQPSQAISIAQALDPQAYTGKLLHVTAEVRSDDPNGRFELFVRGTGPSPDGQSNNTLAVTTPKPTPGSWQELSINIKMGDKQGELNKLALGFAFQGTGRVWARNVKVNQIQPAQLASLSVDPLSKSAPLPEYKAAPTNFEMVP